MKNILSYMSVVFSMLLLVSNSVIALDRYLLNAGDVLDVSVWNEDSLQKTVVVLPDGTISFPLAGELDAEGKSITQLSLALKNKLAEFLAEPLVTVVVANVSGNTVHILGKVLNPGSFVMSRKLNVMHALSLAGGLSPYAEENNIIILRTLGDEQKVIPVKYADIKSGDDISTNIKLQSGDVIVIP